MRQIRDVVLALLLATVPGSAQSYTAAAIKFNNPGPYTQSQLEAAAGIHTGASFTADDLGSAAQRLVDTGYFDNVGATVAPGSDKAITVLFDIRPTDRTQMLHVGFANFVWLTHTEIEAALGAKSALFLDYLPENSPLLDVFNAALTYALAQKGIEAKVTHDTIEPTLRRPERTIEFRIDRPDIRVANLKLSGVASELAPIIQKSVNATARTAYNEGLARQTTADRILAPLYDSGYIQASLANIALAPTVAGDSVTVVLSATLNSGVVYHVSTITFDGLPLLTADAFATTQKLHTGDIASREHLLETLAPLDAAYRRQGYADVIVQAVPTIDEANRSAAYTVSVKPGELYRIHEVIANNLDPAAKADFDRGFMMKQGELFNPEYISTFLKKNTGLRALEGYSAAYKAYADPSTHTVDVVINFVRSAAH